MNIIKQLFTYIELKLYIAISKANIKLIKNFDTQHKELLKIMTFYKVQKNLVELKPPVYEYYLAFNNIFIDEVLNNEIHKSDIPEYEKITEINNPLQMINEGYYCLANTDIHYFAIFDNKKFVLEQLADGLPYKEIYNDDEYTEEGYYKQYIITKKYYHAKKRLAINKVQLSSIPENEKENIQLIDDVTKIRTEGYYKVIS